MVHAVDENKHSIVRRPLADLFTSKGLFLLLESARPFH
jgi:hypothetical protein